MCAIKLATAKAAVPTEICQRPARLVTDNGSTSVKLTGRQLFDKKVILQQSRRVSRVGYIYKKAGPRRSPVN